MKKLSILAVMVLCVFMTVNVYAAEIVLRKYDIVGSNITVSANCDKNTSVRMILKDVNTGEIYAIRDELSDADGKVEFTITMPADVLYGDCELLMKTDSSSVLPDNIVYATEDAVNDLYERLKGVSSSEALLLFDVGAPERVPLKFMSKNIYCYDGFSDEIMKPEFVTWLINNRDDCDNAEKMGNCLTYGIAAVTINHGDKNISDIIETESIAAAEKNWIGNYMLKGVPYSNMNSFAEEYNSARCLYKLNNAGVGNIYDIITKNNVLLKLKNEAVYQAYTSLTTYYRTKADEDMITALVTNPADTREEFKQLFSVAVNKYTGTINSSPTQGDNFGITPGGSSSGGLGGGKGNGSGGGGTIGGGSNIVASAVPLGGQSGPGAKFNDLSGFEWAEDMIYALADRNIINGVGEGRFEPARTVTREELVKMIITARNMKTATGETGFSDVKSGGWYVPYINTALKNGIINGISENEFGLGMPVTRQDMAVMIKRAYGGEFEKIRGKNEFADKGEISEYAAESVDLLYMAGIISGSEDGRYYPGRACTRAEAAKVIYMTFIK